MINEQKTYKLYGYISTDLKPKSHKLIVVICDKCNKEKIVKKCNYNNLCLSCSHIGINRDPFTDEHKANMGKSQKQRRQLPKPKFIKEEDRFIKGTGIDRILTIKRFGYDPIDLKKKSKRKICSICNDCSKYREIIYSQYRDLCSKCAMTKAHKNKIISDD